MNNLGKVLILSSTIIVGTSSTHLTPLGLDYVEASSTEKISKTYYQSTADLNMRSGASLNYKILISIPKGKRVTSIEKKGTWYKVSYSYTLKGKSITKTGWVNGSYLKEYYQYTSTNKVYYFTKKNTRVYSTPDTKKKQIATIASNNGFYSTQKIVNSLGEIWYRIPYNGKSSYIKSSDVTKSTFTAFSQTSYKATVDTALHQFYGNIYKSLVTIPKETIISSNKRIGDWYSVTYAGQTGYVYIGDFSKLMKEITYTSTDTSENFYTTTKAADLYATADSTKEKIYTVADNNIFSSTQMVKNSLGETWYRILYNDQVLYINSEDVRADSFSDSTEKYKANKETTLYESYGNAYKKLTVIPKDTVVTSVKKIGDWYNVTVNGTSGYIYIGDFSKYSDVTEQKITDTTFVTLTKVTIHKKPDKSAELTTTIPNANIVVATYKTSNGWYKIKYDGKTGYVPISSLQQVKTGDPLNGRVGYQFLDLRIPSPVTAKQINDYIEKNYRSQGSVSVLSGKGQAFIDAGNKYGVNALYLAAHAIHESAFGTSQISLGKNNLFGYGAYDASPFIAAYRFDSVEANIEYIARQIKATYLSPGNWRYKGSYLGFSTKDMNNKRIDANSEGMNFYYASDPNWAKGITRHMETILPYDQAYYSGKTADTTVPSLPDIPNGSDIFPEDVLAKANKDLTLNSSIDSNDTITTLKKGSTFTLLEKTNDYWVKVMFEDNTYWTNDIDFVQYKNFISVQNLGRVAVDSLNVRKDPTISADNIITTLNLNDYVPLALNPDGTVIKDDSKSWYQIQLTDGTIGWVSTKYIVQELK